MLIAYSILDNSDESGTTEGVEEEENKPYMTACLLIEKIVKQPGLKSRECFGF